MSNSPQYLIIFSCFKNETLTTKTTCIITDYTPAAPPDCLQKTETGHKGVKLAPQGFLALTYPPDLGFKFIYSLSKPFKRLLFCVLGFSWELWHRGEQHRHHLFPRRTQDLEERGN